MCCAVLSFQLDTSTGLKVNFCTALSFASCALCFEMSVQLELCCLLCFVVEYELWVLPSALDYAKNIKLCLLPCFKLDALLEAVFLALLQTILSALSCYLQSLSQTHDAAGLRHHPSAAGAAFPLSRSLRGCHLATSPTLLLPGLLHQAQQMT